MGLLLFFSVSRRFGSNTILIASRANKRAADLNFSSAIGSIVALWTVSIVRDVKNNNEYMRQHNNN